MAALRSFSQIGKDGLLLKDLHYIAGPDSKPRTNWGLAVLGGQIIDEGPTAEVAARHPNMPTLHGAGYLVIPGLINAHTHAPMGFFRGLAHSYVQKNPDSTMIEDVFFPAERALTSELMTPLSYGYLIDGLRSGVTSFVDAYFHSGSVAKACERLKVRAFVGEHIADLGGPVPAGEELWGKTQKQISNWPFSSLIRPVVYAHAADTVSAPLLKKLTAFAKAEDLPFHMHLSQSFGERDRVLKREGLSPVAFAEACGALTPKSLLVHLVSASSDDLKRIETAGSTAALCPISEILYEKLPPIAEIWKRKIPVALGTDCAASNDTADILRELQTTAILLKNAGLPYEEARLLAAVTSVPARTLGAPELGSLGKGHPADLVMLKIDITVKPLTYPKTNLIFSFGSQHVENVMVDGQWVLWKRDPVFITMKEAEAEYDVAVAKVLKQAGLGPA